MGEKVVVGIPLDKGLRNDVTAFNVDNTNFPVLLNAYQWRGRVKRKRGTAQLSRLQRFFNSSVSSYGSTATITLNGSGVGNLLTGFSLQSSGSIIPGSVTITAPGPTVYTDPSEDGTLSPSGSINYASGQITILAEAGNAVSASFLYYPSLPVMGLEDLILQTNQFPGTLEFDTKYSYNLQTSSPYASYDVSFYKNEATATYSGYTQKTNWTATSWNGQDYQQFWTVNYQGALWATNGINVPFSATNVGMQYKAITTVTVTSATTASLAIASHGLVVGDFVFINEVGTTTGINFQTGYVTTVTDANNVVVTFPNANIATNGTGGIAQYLTSRSDATKDCLRWYDGDPTNGSATSPTFTTGKGWVNFAPPLSQGDYSIADLPADQYYLVGARMIVPFKDRLLFLGPVIQTSAAGSQKYLQDVVIYSDNGTPYYTCSYTGSELSASTVFNPILVPTNQTAIPTAYWEDQTGFGGFIEAGVDRAITTVSVNEDVLIVGFESNLQTRLVYSGNDLVPFIFYSINSELGSGSTFSAVNMDKGVITRGPRGITITSQVDAARIDLDLPDEIFQFRLVDNGTERVTAQRDFINEWVYLSYPYDDINYKFPTQTLQFNYRDNSWGVFRETYTTYGTFRKLAGFTWQTVGLVYPSWNAWNQPWNSGTSNLKQPQVIAGNQQGFVVIRGVGTGEAPSLYIQSVSGNTITSPNHCLSNGDYIMISECLGTVSTILNGKVFSIMNATTNTFQLNPVVDATGLTYIGSGLITRMYKPLIQTKQFPIAWGMGRKTRIGPQMYLLTTTYKSQIQLLIFLSQNAANAYNTGSIVPDTTDLINSSLVYSTVLYTCPESTNLGLTAPNVNLQMPTAIEQEQIWHRINTSLIGDTIQLGFTLSDAQMRELDDEGLPISQFSEIELHGFIIDVQPSQLLS